MNLCPELCDVKETGSASPLWSLRWLAEWPLRPVVSGQGKAVCDLSQSINMETGRRNLQLTDLVSDK